MAAQTGAACVCLDHQLSHGRATRKTPGALIERLRNNKSQNHSWNETIKYVWSSVAERRAQIENTEPSGVQQCLDTMQKVITVKSQQTLKERLHLIGRRLGLNTQIQEEKVSLRTDTFQVDVLLGEGGVISSVRLSNQGDVMECPDLKEILQKGDFSEFIEHLQGLQSIYQVTTDEKLKSKAFVALQALEKDLNQLAQFQSSISGVANYIHKCPLGIMLPRLAGKPMKLIYFVSPYDLLDKKSLAAHPLTVEAITENFLGQSVNVCIEPVPESAPANKLQTMPLMNVNKTQDGKSLPSFSAVSKINSMMLPASFVLVLAQSIPVSTQILHKITSQTGLEIHKEEESRSLRSLILETFSGGDIKEGRRLVVSLPDQQHIYFLDCLNGSCQEQQGMLVSRIPFTHPTHVPQILNLLRQQLLFNIVVGSCVRPGAKPESSNSIVFEVTAVSLHQLTIGFEHPAYDSLIRVDVDLSDITNLKCKVACTNSDQVLCSDEAISRVFHRCMSIPIMLRWLIGKGLGQLDKLKEAALAAQREHMEKEQFLRELKQQQAKFQPTVIQTNRPPPQPPHPPPLPAPPNCPHYHSPVHIADGVMNSHGRAQALVDEFCHLTDNSSQHVNDRLPISPDNQHVPQSVLIPLLHEQAPTNASNPKEVHDAPMLSRLLDDNTSVATTVIPMDCKPSFMTCVKRARKRKTLSDSSGPSPKQHLSDGDFTERFAPLGASMDVDLLPGVIDHHLHHSSPAIRSMTPTYGSPGHHAHHPVLNRAPARSHHSVIDLTEDSSVGESSLKRLSDLSMLFNETEAQNRIPNILHNSPSGSKTEAQSRIANMLHNSPSGSKNENASTSLEGYLKGSGEVGRAKDFDSSDASSGHSNSTVSKLSSLLLASSESPSPCLSVSPHRANSTLYTGKPGSDQLCSSGLRTSPANNAGVQDVKPSAVSLTQGALCQASNVDLINDRKSLTGSLLDKFDISRQQKHVKTEAVSHEVRSQLVEGKVSLRLKVGPLKQQNNIKAFVKSYKSGGEAGMCGKSNNLATFDFKSDEDDDAPLVHVSSDRFVYSSSPTCLQISSRQKQLTDLVSIQHKSDKVRKKDKSSGNTAKRKREKDKSKREKKKKRSEHCVEESVYRTVENDAKGDFKMKIRVKPMTDKSHVFSDGKVPSYEITKKPLVNSTVKLLTSREHNKAAHVNEVSKEQDSAPDSNSHHAVSGRSALLLHKSSSTLADSNSHHAVSGRSALLLHKSSSKLAVSKMSPNVGPASKTDPKLVTKATIRLKPVTMPNSSATVNIAQSASGASAAHKSQRRNSACVVPPVSDKRLAVHHSLERRGSASNLIDRRSIPQSSSSSTSLSASTTSTATTSAPTTPTTSATLSLSSILPNAPTISKIASLPRIPKLSSSSSNASITRTSSLDAVLESGPISAGTKANNSYTVGPAGRAFPGPISATGVSRPSAGSTAPFSYGSRPMTPGNGGSGAGWSTFNANRPGSTHRQTSPLINTNQAGLHRPAGPRAQSPSLGQKSGFRSTGGHKHAGSVTNSQPMKGGAGSTQNMFGGGGGGGHASSQVSGHVMGHKPSPGSARTQKHPSPNTHISACSRTSAVSGNLSTSPNTHISACSGTSAVSGNLSTSPNTHISACSRTSAVSGNLSTSPNTHISACSRTSAVSGNLSTSPNTHISACSRTSAVSGNLSTSPNTHISACSRTSAVSGNLSTSPNTHISACSRTSAVSGNLSTSPNTHISACSRTSAVSGNLSTSPNTHISACSRTSAVSGNLSTSPNTSGMTKSPNSGRSPNISNPGRSPSVNSGGKSPNVSAASRSPNISNHSERLTGSCSTARHRHSPGVPKCIMKTHYSSTTHRTSTGVSGSMKSSPTQTGHSAFSNSPHTVDSTLVAAVASPMSNIPSETSSVSCLPSTESPSPCVEKLSACQPHATPVFSSSSSVTTSSATTSSVTTSSSLSVTTISSSSVSTSSSPLSVVQANTVDPADSSRDSRTSAAAAVDTNHLLPSDKPSSSPTAVSAQSAAVTAQGADGIKNRLHSCSSRGRKSSLSAIVDKLKHSAVGSSLASPGLVPPFSESLSSKMSESFLGVEDGKSSVSSSSTQGERTLSSQLAMSGAESDSKRINHVCEGNHKQAVYTEKNEVMTADTLMAPHTDSVRNIDTLSSQIVCDQDKSIEDETTRHVPRVAAKEESSHMDGIRLLDKLVQLGPLREQTCASSDQESLVTAGHTPAAPPFHPLQSPAVAIRNSSPLTVARDSHPGLRLASAKPPAECLDADKICVNSLHLGGSSRLGDSRDNHVTESLDDTASAHVQKNSSKPLSSPLSDISSPGSDLVIDHEDGTHKVSSNCCRFSRSNSIPHGQSSHGSSFSQCLVENCVPASNLDHLTLTSCPGTTSPPALSASDLPGTTSPPALSASNLPGTTSPPALSASKSASLAKYPSRASSSKESDSPCPIDDDLMDMALGFGS